MNKIKITIVSLLCVVFMVGCFKITINKEVAKNILIKNTSRALAYRILLNNPKYIDNVEIYCKAIQGKDVISQQIINTGTDFLAGLLSDDPVLNSLFLDLKELIVIDVASPDFDMSNIKLVAVSFYEGAELAKLQLNK